MPAVSSQMIGGKSRSRLFVGGLGRPTRGLNPSRLQLRPARRRVTGDYASRRGADPENTRRRPSSSFAPPSVTQAPPRGNLRLAKNRNARPRHPSPNSGQQPQETPRQVSAGYSAAPARAPIDPRVARRNSIDYAARRSGATRENQRSGSLSSWTPAASSSAPVAAAHNGRAPIDPRVARRQSIDYADRRSGATRENQRSGGGSMAPLSSARRGSGSAPIDPRVARRQSVDYAARRSGVTRENQRSNNNSNGTSARRSGSAPVDPRVARRQSVDYAARRSGATRENQRSSNNNNSGSSVRRSGSAPIDPHVARRQSVDYAARRSGGTREARRSQPPQNGMLNVSRNSAPPMDPRVARRKSVDYASRRAGNSRQSRDFASGSEPPRRPSASGLDGVSLRPPPIVRRKVPSYEARRSRNYDTAHSRRLRQQYTVGEVQAVLAARNNLPPTVVEALDKAARRLSGDMRPPQPTAKSPRVSPDEENVRRGLGPSAMAAFTSNGASSFEHADHAKPALKAVDDLMLTICNLGNVSLQQLKEDAGGHRPSTHRNRHYDPADSAMANLNGLANVIVQLGNK